MHHLERTIQHKLFHPIQRNHNLIPNNKHHTNTNNDNLHLEDTTHDLSMMNQSIVLSLLRLHLHWHPITTIKNTEDCVSCGLLPRDQHPRLLPLSSEDLSWAWWCIGTDHAHWWWQSQLGSQTRWTCPHHQERRDPSHFSSQSCSEDFFSFPWWRAWPKPPFWPKP